MSELSVGAQVQIAQAAAPVGEIAELTGDVFITRANGETVEASVGTPVFQNDTFETGPDAGVGINFADDSAFSLGGDARLTIDEFVYDPGGDSGMAMNLVQGAFSFVSGQIAKTGDNNMTIVTPTATIGVRGTAGAGDEDEAVLLQEPGQPLGEMTVTTPGGTVTLNSVNAYTNTSDPLAPPTPPEFRPLDQIQAQFGGALRGLPGFTPGNQDGPGEDGGEGENGEGETGDADTEADGEADGDQDPDGDGEEGGGPDGQQGETGEQDGLDGEGPEEDAALDGPADEQLGADGEIGSDGGLDPDGGLGGPDDGLGAGDGFDTGEIGDDVGGPDDVIDGQEGTLAESDFDNTQDDFFDGISQGAEQQAGGTGEGNDLGGGDPDDILGDGLGGGDGLFGGGDDGLGGTGEDDPLGGPDDDFNPGEEIPPEEEEPPEGSVLEFSFNSDDGSPTHTLISGASEVVTLEDNVTVSIVGIAEGTDSFVDGSGGNSTNQQITLEDGGSHTFSATNIDDILFNSSLSNSDVQNILIFGTNQAVINGFGDFNGLIVSDNQDNIINIGVGFSTAEAIVGMTGGTDTLNVNVSVSSTVQVSGVENMNGGGGNDTVTVLDSLTSGSVYDGQGGTDQLILTDGTNNSATVTNFETITSTTSSGVTLTLENSGTFDFAFTGTGQDTVNFFSGNDTITARGIENINAGAGTDSLILADTGSAQTVTVTGFVAAAETITGSVQNDTVLIGDNAVPTIDLAGGVDEVQNASGGGLSGLQLSNVERYQGNGSADDVTSLTLLTGTATNVFDGGGGTDSLTLSTGANTLSATNFETINGAGAADTLTLEASLNGGTTTVNLQGGTDNLVLADGGNNLLVVGTENVTGGTGNDTVQLNDATIVTLDLGTGGDTVVNVGNQGLSAVTLTNVENYAGGTSFDQVFLTDNLATGASFDGGGGAGDILGLNGGVNSASITDFDQVNGTGIADTLTLETAIAAAFATDFDMGTGIDTLNLANGTNVLDVEALEFLNGNAGSDTVTLLDTLAASSVYDGAGGTDTLNLFAGTNVASIVNFENIDGSAGAESLTLENVVTGGTTTVDLKGGTDSLQLANGANELFVIDTETVTGGTGNDTVTHKFGVSSSLNLGAGDDTVNNIETIATTLTLTDVEFYNGSTANDTVILNSLLSATKIFDGGAGTDSLTLFTGVNVASLIDFETIIGSAGVDSLTLENGITGGTTEIDLGSGADDLTLTNLANDLRITDVETVTGGTDNDVVRLTNAGTVSADLGAGTDEFVFEIGGGTLTATNIETATGSAGTDTVNLSNAGETITVRNIETVNGGTGADSVTHAEATGTTTLSLGAGNDTVTNTATVATALILADVEQYIGSTANDTVSLNNVLVSTNNYDGGTGTDTLNLFGGTSTASITNFENINGSATIDSLTLEASLLGFATTINLGASNDTVTLFSAGNSVQIEETENIFGGAGADLVRTTNTGAINFDGGGGTDSIELQASGGSVTITSVELVTGTGSGNSVTLSAAGETTAVSGIDAVFGGVGNDFVTLNDNTGINLTLSTGTDTVTNASNLNTTISLSDVEIFNGGTGDEIITVNTALLAGAVYNGGGGADDRVILTANNNTASFVNFDLIQGTGTDDTLTLETGIQASSGTTIDLLSTVDADTLNLANANNDLSVQNVETINGGTGNDTVVNVGATGATFNLGGGGDTATGTGSGVRDDFVYVLASDAAVSAGERITNFEINVDKLNLQALTGSTIVYNGIGFSGPASAGFVDGVSNVLQIDLNGDLTADLEITLDGVTSADLDQADLIVSS